MHPLALRPAHPAGPRYSPACILEAVVQLAHEHDALWMRRRRVLNTLLVVLFVFRLVFAPTARATA